MKNLWLCLIFGLFAKNAFSQLEKRFFKNETYKYPELIQAYDSLSRIYKEAHLQAFGTSDYGLPIYCFTLNSNGNFNPNAAENQQKSVLLINNGIHPGEPCGVDASLHFADSLLRNKLIPDSVIICIIPLYNVGGSFNIRSTSRANQDGPVNQGFRGNAKNLDLNRDFIKADSKNTLAFYSIFHHWNPHVFIDTHTSNGADYQYTMTLISTQKDKLNPYLSSYLTQTFEPDLYSKMEEYNWPMTPYVYSKHETPNSGLIGFLETPRYSTGYTTLFNCIGFVSEAHMLKSYPHRVLATWAFINATVNHMQHNTKKLIQNKQLADILTQQTSSYPTQFQWNGNDSTTIQFMGFKALHVKSLIGNYKRLLYDRTQPENSTIGFFNSYSGTDSTQVPDYYLIPQSYINIIHLLNAQQIEYTTLQNDTQLKANALVITQYETSQKAYEGHYLHSKIDAAEIQTKVSGRKGDVLVPTNTKNRYFLHQTLEPKSVDSYFAWNYFDSHLMQKEGFSDYVFEDIALQLLENNPQLQHELDSFFRVDPNAASNKYQVLNFIYKRSEYYENTVNKLPYYKVYK